MEFGIDPFADKARRKIPTYILRGERGGCATAGVQDCTSQGGQALACSQYLQLLPAGGAHLSAWGDNYAGLAAQGDQNRIPGRRCLEQKRGA